MVWEINKNEKAIKSVLGLETNLFRAPYGALTEDMVKKLHKMDYLGIGWSIDSEDWKGLSKEEIKKQVINNLHPGSIVLMHAAGDIPGTEKALDELLTYLKEKGYHFVTIPELWQMNHYK